METTEHFKFFDPGYLTDGDLQLVLLETRPPIPEKGRVPEYKFEIRSNGTRAGNISFRTNLTEQLARYGGHIGYDVAPEFRGNNLAARSCRLLFGLARTHGLGRLLVTCDPENIASRKTIEKIGGQLATIGRVTTEDGTERDTCYYHIEIGAGI